jgi:hypothetical protein
VIVQLTASCGGWGSGEYGWVFFSARFFGCVAVCSGGGVSVCWGCIVIAGCGAIGWVTPASGLVPFLFGGARAHCFAVAECAAQSVAHIPSGSGKGV